jgi:UDP-glucose:(heptosyl)LPS alpha-1,3-glucosyltransferase
MKVAFLIEHLDSARGGMERSATEFLTEVARVGVDIQAVTQTVSPKFSAAAVHLVGVARGGRARRYREFVERADAVLAASEWDVIHSVAPCLRCDLYQPRSGTVKEALARTVAVRRNSIARSFRKLGAWLDLKHRLLGRLENDLFLKRPSLLVAALSFYMQRQIVELYGLPEERVRIVFNGVTVPFVPAAEGRMIRQRIREELGLSQDALVALFVGHNFRRKGLLRLVEAMAKPAAASWQLLVLGKDSPTRYRAAAVRLGIESRVRFLGSRADIHDLYRAADTGVLPTYYDPCARTVLEGLSLGLPYITTAFDGSSDCIINGKHGFVIDSPDSVDAIAAALQRLSDPNVRSLCAENALALRRQLSMSRHAEEVVRLYEEIAARKRSKVRAV